MCECAMLVNFLIEFRSFIRDLTTPEKTDKLFTKTHILQGAFHDEDDDDDDEGIPISEI